MAIYKVKHEYDNYKTDADVERVLKYITRADKTCKELIVGSAVIPEIARVSYEAVTDAYHNSVGTHLRHSILNFSEEDEISISEALDIAKAVIRYYGGDYQIIAAVHTDHPQPHIHFVMNTTNYRTGKKYKGDRKDYHAFHRYLNEVVRPYGIHVDLKK